jgi:hypothetical protein
VPIAAFDRRKHGAYVYSYFAMGSGEPRERLDDLFEAGARCEVAFKADAAPPKDLAAFAIVSADGTVVWCHTKPPGRKRGLMRALLANLGVDIEKPMTAMFWSPAIPQMRRRGFVINPPKETESHAEREQDEAGRQPATGTR